MNKKEAEQLLEDVFHNPFNEKKFSEFITEFLNGKMDTDKKPAIWASSTFKDYIVNSKCLGTYIDTNKKAIAIVTVELKKTKSVEKARTIQRNFIANYLNKSGLDAAIIAFYGDDGDDWRLSFVKLEYKNVNVGGKLKSETELTPVKRYSYLVGKHEANHTCKSQLSPILQDDKLDTTLEEIEKAFSVDKVTKEFFDKYKELFFRLNDSLTELMKNDKKIQKEFEEKDIKPDEFSKKLLGQIVFLFFLQKKGWMGIQKDKEGDFENWGTGPKDFLQQLFGKRYLNYNNFFNDILEPLFYEALAKDRRDNSNYYSKLKCKIPFLNGGLFEPINDYSWEKTDILIDNAIFKEILEVFSQYNFTVKEDEPLEKEVAVDPEMLGKVFENLLEIRDRKSKGSYYTPREIVHYMCQQSLINYLETNLEAEKVSKEDIESFILNGDLTLAELIREQEEKKQGNTYAISNRNYELPDSIKKNFKKTDTLLKDVKIADPAVGSGAFPVGMMNEIVKARSILSVLYPKKEQDERTNYNLKRETIENSLYGVDIDPAAVEISKLRFWLSLIVDEDDIDNIKPLPNLDNKIMCGNSLLDSFEGVKLIDDNLFKDNKQEKENKITEIRSKLSDLYKEKGQVAIGKSNKDSKEIEKEIKVLEKQKQEIINPKEKFEYTTISDAIQRKVKESKKKLLEMQKLQKEYFNEEDRLKKKTIFKQIEDIEWGFIEEKLKEQNSQEALAKLQQIKKSKSKPFFIWELYFNDVFNRQNPGFDIVIGNPPYIRIQKLDPVISQYIKKRFVVAKGKFDIYTLFYEIGFYILRNSGTITYISSNSFLMQDFGEELRNYLSKNNFAQKILDFGHNQVFENASTYTLIFLGKKEKLKYIEYNKAYYLGNNSDFDFKKIQFTRSTDYGVNFKWENILRDDLISKIYANSKILENYAYTRSPLFTGMDDLLLKENNIDNKYICETIWREIIKPKEIKKHHILVSKQKVFFPYQLINDKFVLINESEFRQKYPLTYDYLFKFKSELLNRKDSGKNFIELGKPWYALMRVGEPSDYNLNKIITPSVINKSNFAFDNSKRIYPTGGTYGLIPKNNAMSLKFIYALLNSKLYLYIVMLMATPKRGGYVAISARNIKQLPIKDINSVKQKPFIELVDKILNITKDEDYLENKSKQQKVKQLESEIDKLVYKLYELTTEEIKIVEGIN